MFQISDTCIVVSQLVEGQCAPTTNETNFTHSSSLPPGASPGSCIIILLPQQPSNHADKVATNLQNNLHSLESKENATNLQIIFPTIQQTSVQDGITVHLSSRVDRCNEPVILYMICQTILRYPNPLLKNGVNMIAGKTNDRKVTVKKGCRYQQPFSLQVDGRGHGKPRTPTTRPRFWLHEDQEPAERS